MNNKHLTTKAKPKLQRNDLCHCGSGIKYKKCCLDKDSNRIWNEQDLVPKKQRDDGELWILRIECVGGAYYSSEWIRRVEIDSNSSLSDLQYHINKMIDFDFDHLYDFYASRTFRSKKLWFTEDGEFNSDIDYNSIPLSNIYPLPKSLKLYYFFDYGDSWTFEIRRERKKVHRDPNIKYPRIVEAIGENPEQYPSYEE